MELNMKQFQIEEIKNKIIEGDALEILPRIPDNSVDLILTDPPYGISNETRITRTKNTMKFKATTDLISNFGSWDKFENIHQFMEFTYRWVQLAIPKLRPGGMFISYFDRDKINFLSQFLQKSGFKSKGYFAHIKSNPVPQARKVKWMNAWEIVGMWQKSGGKLTYNYQLGQHPDYMIVPIVGGKERLNHPTQKPLKIAKLFISYWTNKGDLVLDPFCGVGTFPLACKQLGRNFIGIEKDPKYVEIARMRIRTQASPLL